eukprot:c7601_g1_i1 orf=50-223(+)
MPTYSREIGRLSLHSHIHLISLYLDIIKLNLLSPYFNKRTEGGITCVCNLLLKVFLR